MANNPASTESNNQAKRDPELQNEGEGSRSAARRYDTEAERAAKDPREVEKLAKKAAQALDGKEGKTLKKAEERGRRAEHGQKTNPASPSKR